MPSFLDTNGLMLPNHSRGDYRGGKKFQQGLETLTSRDSADGSCRRLISLIPGMLTSITWDAVHHARLSSCAMVTDPACSAPRKPGQATCATHSQPRIADAGITGYEHEFRCAVGHNPVEGRSQSVNLVLSPESFSGISDRSGTSCLPNGKGGDVALSFPFRQAPWRPPCSRPNSDQ